MIITKRLLALLCCGLLIGCAGSGTAPLQFDEVRAVVLHNLSIIETGINAEDIFLASQPISDQFTMDNNVATRYSTEWTGVGVGEFRNFWNRVFLDNANIEFRVELTELELSGDIATALCNTDYAAQRPDVVPPEIRVATDSDYLQFERSGGRWLLRRWEIETAPVHGEGLGASL
jgi:hypothetical protein